MRRFLGFGFFVILILFICVIADAINVNEIIKNFKKKYVVSKSFTADFEQTTLISGRKSNALGRVSFQKPNLLRQEYFDPSKPDQMTQLIVSDGKTLWSYTPLVKQVTKQTLSQDKQNTELLPGFGPSLENIEKNYSLKLVEDKLAKKNGVHVVELIPKSGENKTETFFDTMQVWLRDADSVPVQFMYKNNNNEMTFIMSFKNFKIDEKINQETFSFTVPKGTQVVTVPGR